MTLLLALAGCAGGPPERRADAGFRDGPIALADPRGADAVVTALSFVDLPYRYGGNSAATGFDCSGFTRHVYAHSVGLQLPRRSDEQAGAAGLQAVSRDALQPGDLVFFDTLGRAYSHVGIYVGDGRFVHAPKTGAQVRVESLRGPYWSRRFRGAWRAASPARAAASPSPAAVDF